MQKAANTVAEIFFSPRAGYDLYLLHASGQRLLQEFLTCLRMQSEEFTHTNVELTRPQQWFNRHISSECILQMQPGCVNNKMQCTARSSEGGVAYPLRKELS